MGKATRANEPAATSPSLEQKENVLSWELDSAGSGQSAVAGFCEQGNETLCSVKGGELQSQFCE